MSSTLPNPEKFDSSLENSYPTSQNFQSPLPLTLKIPKFLSHPQSSLGKRLFKEVILLPNHHWNLKYVHTEKFEMICNIPDRSKNYVTEPYSSVYWLFLSLLLSFMIKQQWLVTIVEYLYYIVSIGMVLYGMLQIISDLWFCCLVSALWDTLTSLFSLCNFNKLLIYFQI